MTILSYNAVKKFFEKFECTLLETNYISADQRLKFRCKCGNIH